MLIQGRSRSWVLAGLLAAIAVGLAGWAFGHGLQDWRFQMAGLADPFLGRPAPATSVILGLVLTGLAMLGWRLAQRAMRVGHGTGAEPVRWRRRTLVMPILVVWGGYILGASAVIARGGPTDYRATMLFEFDRPLGATAEVPASCRSVVGEPRRVAEITPQADGLFRINLRNVATGGADPWSADPTAILANDGVPGNDFTFSSLPDRPAPYLELTLDDGSLRSEPPISFLGAYDQEVTNVVDSGLSGVARMTGSRFRDSSEGGSERWVNLVIADDPWPDTFGLTISWTCLP